jgi:hypothetical protein
VIRQSDLACDRIDTHVLDKVPLPQIAGHALEAHRLQDRQPARVTPVLACKSCRGGSWVEHRQMAGHPVLMQAACEANAGEAVACANHVLDKLADLSVSVAVCRILGDDSKALTARSRLA